jgi:hypothetical protein
VALDSMKENDFHSGLEAWEKTNGIAVCVSKENVLKEMAAKIENVKLTFLFV